MILDNHLSRVGPPKSPVAVIEIDRKDRQSLNIVLQEPMDAHAFVTAVGVAEVICRHTGRSVYICTTAPRTDWNSPYLAIRAQLMVRGKLIPGLREWNTKVTVLSVERATDGYWGGGREFRLDFRFTFDELGDWALNYIKERSTTLMPSESPQT